MINSTESRYAHLLQPIRELTKNWDIDVASELNDYLEELDEMCITLDGGNIRLNFAEAALLIQGSACIYSKKVELLHNLVYQTLEYISEKKKKRSKEAADAQEGEGGASQGNHDDDDEAEFTPLDLEVSKASQRLNSSKPVDVVPLPPESLIPLETHEKHKLPLISLKGEVVFSQKDFRINQFIPGENNVILLSSRSAEAFRFLIEDRPEDLAVQEQPSAAAVSGHGGEDVEDFLPVDVHMEPEEPEEHVERQQCFVSAEAQTVRQRRQVNGDPQKHQERPAVDVWTLHDPYVVLGEERPFKAGKCYKVPAGLDEGGKRKRKRAPVLQDFRNWFRGTFDPPEPKLKTGPSFTDLNYIYVRAVKDRVKTQRRINRRAGVVMMEEELIRTLLQPEEAGPQQQGAEPVDVFRHADLAADEDVSDNEQDVFPDDCPAQFGEVDLISADAQRDELSYEELVKLRIEQLVSTCKGYTQETALARRVKDWEDKIHPELELQEERPPFDIHDYGERIKGALGGVGCRKSFASLVHGLDNFEACKYLLASLQLANDYTVEIDSAAGLDQCLDSMSLTLLSTHRTADRFKTLPSERAMT